MTEPADRHEIVTTPPKPVLGFLSGSDELVSLLHTMNEAGIDPTLVGVDNRGLPFLIQLIGAYAESTAVLYGSPWDSEVEYNNGRYCEECNASNLFCAEDLTFPVFVMMNRSALDQEMIQP